MKLESSAELLCDRYIDRDGPDVTKVYSHSLHADFNLINLCKCGFQLKLKL